MMQAMKSRWPTAALLIAVAVPPAAVLHLILTRGVNVPYFDEWSLVPFVLKARAGTVTWQDLWAQHNEHRIASIRLVTLLLLPWTKFNVVVHMLAAFAIAVASLALMWRALRLTFSDTSALLPLALTFVASVFVFSVVQYETWIYSLPALQGQQSTFCAALTVWAFARWPGQRRALLIASLSTLVSMTALASGLALWCAAIVGTLLFRYARREPISQTVVVGTGVLLAMTAAYFAGYHRPEWHPDPMQAFRTPIGVLRFIAAYLATPLAYGRDPIAAAAMGATSFMLACGILWLSMLDIRRAPSLTGPTIPWIALWIYSVMVAALTAVGRVGLGPGAALAPRYAAAAALFWIASSVIAVLAWRRHRERLWPAWRVAGVCAAAIGIALAAREYDRAYRTGRQQAERFSARLAIVKAELMLVDSASDTALAYLYPPDPSIPRKYAGLLRDAGLGPFDSEK